MAEALRTAGKMTDTLLKRFIFVENSNGMIGKQLILISSPQIQILLVQRPFGTYNHIIFEGKCHGTACSSVFGDLVRSSRGNAHSDDFEWHKSIQTNSWQQILLAGLWYRDIGSPCKLEWSSRQAAAGKHQASSKQAAATSVCPLNEWSMINYKY